VRQAVVCDCLKPPVHQGVFDLLIANNFLHHVTNKSETLRNWSRIAEKVVFNENTSTWASGWPVPYILKRLGKREKAATTASEIEKLSLQCLKSKPELEGYVNESLEIKDSVSYLAERTFFYCGLFSWVMRCYGPPTPSIVKGLFLRKPFRWIVLPLTADIAKLLIRYDEQQDRATDSFISYICTSRNYESQQPQSPLTCPDCESSLTADNNCSSCGRHFSHTDGMLFLLPREMEDLQHDYNREVSTGIPQEHL
jgi:DNA-directed RNA polymerase subunit RPC12/RpoP